MLNQVGNSSTCSLIVDFTGKLIFSSIPLPKFNNSEKDDPNLFQMVMPEFHDELSKVFLLVKNGEQVFWQEKNVGFNDKFEYKIDKFFPLYEPGGKVCKMIIYLNNREYEILEQTDFSENKFESLFNNVRDAIFVTDLKGNFIEVNKTALDRTGFTKEHFLTLNIKNTPIRFSSQIFANYFQEIMLFGNSMARVDYLHLEGYFVETEISGKLFKYNGQEAVLHVSRDVSGRNKIHASDIDALVQTEERERSGFAHQLNDVLGANLAMLKMYIESYFKIDKKIERDNIAEKIKSIIDDALGHISEISNKISPHILKNLGLKVALEVFIKKIQEDSKINFNFRFDIPEKLREDVAIVLYRVVLEILNNIVKHSNASNASLNAECTNNNSIVFEIIDDGVGFDVEEAFANKDKIGMLNVLNKIKSVKGLIDYFSKSGEGTCVKIEIPIDERD